MSQIECFWLEPTNQFEYSLRRYKHSDFDKAAGVPVKICPLPHGYHDARRVLGRGEAIHSPLDMNGCGNDSFPHNDPRWPTHCECGYEFQPEDAWQYNEHRLYVKQGTTEPGFTYLHYTPPGAMWDAYWMGDGYKGPDGIHLVVMTPGGEWAVDGPAYDGNHNQTSPRGWQRTGAIPKVTATPSILIPGKYHGWLRDGLLVPC